MTRVVPLPEPDQRPATGRRGLNRAAASRLVVIFGAALLVAAAAVGLGLAVALLVAGLLTIAGGLLFVDVDADDGR